MLGGGAISRSVLVSRESFAPESAGRGKRRTEAQHGSLKPRTRFARSRPRPRVAEKRRRKPSHQIRIFRMCQTSRPSPSATADVGPEGIDIERPTSQVQQASFRHERTKARRGVQTIEALRVFVPLCRITGESIVGDTPPRPAPTIPSFGRISPVSAPDFPSHRALTWRNADAG